MYFTDEQIEKKRIAAIEIVREMALELYQYGEHGRDIYKNPCRTAAAYALAAYFKTQLVSENKAYDFVDRVYYEASGAYRRSDRGKLNYRETPEDERNAREYADAIAKRAEELTERIA